MPGCNKGASLDRGIGAERPYKTTSYTILIKFVNFMNI